MAIIKTAKKIEIGDEILPWADTDEEHNEFIERVKKAKEEIKSLPNENRYVTFLMRKSYSATHSQNSKILYKRTVKGFYPATGMPDYKDHFLKFNWGMIRTSNYEEIAFLDMHSMWFVREENKELTSQEKMAKELKELKAELELIKGSKTKEIKEDASTKKSDAGEKPASKKSDSK